jgi:hypothetical protein
MTHPRLRQKIQGRCIATSRLPASFRTFLRRSWAPTEHQSQYFADWSRISCLASPRVKPEQGEVARGFIVLPVGPLSAASRSGCGGNGASDHLGLGARSGDFFQALQSWKRSADDRAEHMPYQRAVGHSYDAVEVMEKMVSPRVRAIHRTYGRLIQVPRSPGYRAAPRERRAKT